MNTNIDYQKLFDLKLKGEPDSKALLASGATRSIAITKFERRHKRIREVIALANDYWRYNIYKGSKRITNPRALGERLAKTAMNPKDNFNSTNAIKVLTHIIMRKQQETADISNSPNVNIQNVYIVPPQMSKEEWRRSVEQAGTLKPQSIEAEKEE